MASKKARELRREFRKNGFLVVESMYRRYKKTFGREKVELFPVRGEPRESPKDATAKTHPYLFISSVKQVEALETKFKVVREKNSLVTIHRKNGSGLKPMRTYYWSGRKLWLLTPEDFVRRDVAGKAPEALFRQDLPRLTHEQCVDIENALIRL